MVTETATQLDRVCHLGEPSWSPDRVASRLRTVSVRERPASMVWSSRGSGDVCAAAGHAPIRRRLDNDGTSE